MENNKKFYCSLEIITPVHIGTGEDYYPSDYYFSDTENKLIFFDKTVISRLIYKEGEETFEKFISASEQGDYLAITRLMKKHIDSAKTAEVSASGFLIKETLAKKADLHSHPISKHIKEPFNMLPYIPGSTLKGLIRTAFNYEFLKNNLSAWDEMLAKESGQREKSFLAERIAKRYNPKLFGCDFLDTEYGGARQDDPFRCIKVSDFMFVEGGTRIDRVLNLTKAGEENAEGINSIPDILELCVKGTLFYGEIDLSLIDKLETDTDTRFSQLVNKYLGNDLDKARIDKILKEYYEKLFAKERKEFAEKNVQSIKNINRMEVYSKWWENGLDFDQKGTCYIKLGKHGGAISKTTAGGDDDFKKYRKINIPQIEKTLDCQLTNWISSAGEPLGWAKIEFLTDEQAEMLIKKRDQFIASQKKEREDRIEEIEKAKISAMEDKKREAEKIANMSELEKRIYDFQNETNPNLIGGKEFEIYKMLDDLDGKDRKKAAEVLRDHYQQTGKWKKVKKKSAKKERVKKIREILGI